MRKTSNKALGVFKDIHQGERVFLIGNGPSLNSTNLDLLENETSIAMNRIPLLYPRYPKWRPTYYLFCSTNIRNPVWGREWRQTVRTAVRTKGTTSFLGRKFKKDIGVLSPFSKIVWLDSVTETKPSTTGEISPDSFSINPVERIDKSGTSMNLALQLAYYMGFSEIVLLGVDLGWSQTDGISSDANHFDQRYRASISNPAKANQQMRNVHSLAYRRFLERDEETKLFNASTSSILDIYPMINFEIYVEERRIALDESRLCSARREWDCAPQFGSIDVPNNP